MLNEAAALETESAATAAVDEWSAPQEGRRVRFDPNLPDDDEEKAQRGYAQLFRIISMMIIVTILLVGMVESRNTRLHAGGIRARISAVGLHERHRGWFHACVMRQTGHETSETDCTSAARLLGAPALLDVACLLGSWRILGFLLYFDTQPLHHWTSARRSTRLKRRTS
ncbi:uncharacterized protein [Dermacentor andersoni]|uniref:uncharacterized protein n=1 Tax=Dermacentor andersoni TaxID=34620 RepID=UPI0024167915|nr:uncharacterized protein LOC129382503 [Dermacentor andersoni]